MAEREVFLMNPMHQFIYPNEEKEFVVPNHLKRGDYYVNLCLSNWKTNFNSKNGRKVIFPLKPKHQYHLSQWVECVYSVKSWKKMRLLRKSVFTPIDRQNLIIKKGGKWSFTCETKA